MNAELPLFRDGKHNSESESTIKRVIITGGDNRVRERIIASELVHVFIVVTLAHKAPINS